MYFNPIKGIVMTANTAVAVHYCDEYQAHRDVKTDEYGEIIVTYGLLPAWNPDIEALRLRINTRDQTVTADTVAHDFGDDVDTYNAKVCDEDAEVEMEYRVMVYNPENTEYATQALGHIRLQTLIEDLIIADKLYHALSDDCSWLKRSDQIKWQYAKRMVQKHLEEIREYLDPDN